MNQSVPIEFRVAHFQEGSDFDNKLHGYPGLKLRIVTWGRVILYILKFEKHHPKW